MIIQDDRLMDRLPYALPPSASPEHTAFLDLETKNYGQKNSRIQYLGLIFFQKDGWYVRQWLPETLQDEPAMLREAIPLLESFSSLIHYNGNSFDLPVLKRRAKALSIPLELASKESLDLYRSFAPLKRLLGLSSLTQRSLEQFLGVSRDGNDQNDLLMLPQLLPLFAYLKLLDGKFTVQKATLNDPDHKPFFTAQALLDHPVPNEFSLHLDNGYVTCRGTELRILWYGIYGTLKYFYSDYRNYYYLPTEDTAIHKSVAAYVDREHRQPAKASTCYTRKTGCFLPQKEPLLQPAFSDSYKDRRPFLLCDERFLSDPETIRKFILNTVLL